MTSKLSIERCTIGRWEVLALTIEGANPPVAFSALRPIGMHGVQEVPGSSPGTPTHNRSALLVCFCLWQNHG